MVDKMACRGVVWWVDWKVCERVVVMVGTWVCMKVDWKGNTKAV